MTTGGKSNLLLLLLCTFLFPRFEVNALSYDYSASIECLENPHKPQYGGGIIVNPELNHGLRGWSTFGNAKLQHRESQAGNKFAVACNRNQPHAGISQKTYLQGNKLYTFSAWIQVSGGRGVPVTAIFKTSSGSFIHAGAIVAESNCWSMMKGGLTVNASGPAELYFESKSTSVDIWVDSVSLQQFTEKEWKSHHDQSIEKNRKSNVRIQAVDAEGNPLRNATISIQQKAPSFPFGCAMNKNILANTAYQNWFTSRFGVTTFENEMKWYSTENSQGKEDYSVADAMLQFAKQHNIAVRDHNVFWDDPQYQLGWLTSLDKHQLALAAFKRLYSVMNRYKGQVVAWDVVNENLHFDFFESKWGKNSSAILYNWATKADGETTLFMNEFNTIEESEDGDSTPAKYLQKLRDIQAFPGNNNLKMAIGLESHFRSPTIPYIRSSIDTLAAANLPIWITELDIQSGPNQAWYLEQIMREVYTHPKIQGIIIWAAWRPEGCYRMCLTDNNFKNLPTGDVVDKLLSEWGLKAGFAFSATTDTNGVFEASLPHGDYEVQITDLESVKVSNAMVQGLNVAASSSASQQPLLVQLAA
ncbi:hypothetical protein ACLB2K_030231 [Fragaria x ananassa]